MSLNSSFAVRAGNTAVKAASVEAVDAVHTRFLRDFLDDAEKECSRQSGSGGSNIVYSFAAGLCRKIEQ